ncbi:putative phosphomannomutase [Magnetofaba australis IT-1]|uniref:Putative phosphomannomutase n=2 Tax=Magnetofaba TaxID=1472292 RepID=A0A1Y2K7T7_9PROT|nr:putative phosphomannomutase [Magnetofaba australis IT-1]
MVTGSHNPGHYNGLKMTVAGRPFFGDDIQRLKKRANSGDLPTAPGGMALQRPIIDDYVARLAADHEPGRKLKIVIDCGNGVSGAAAQPLLNALQGISGEVLFPEIDGSFPNHHPDPTHPENLVDLRNRMLQIGADLGIAFDGDADRIGVLDETGRVLWGDRLMVLFSREILSRHPGAAILGDVKCSDVMFDAINAAGGQAVMWKTGHSLVKTKMRETGALLAGEMSGHLFFADRYYGYDDALYAMVRLLNIAAATDQPLSALLADLPEVFATPELRIDCDDARKFAVMESLKAQAAHLGDHRVDIDGLRVHYRDGWWLIRVSNTQPALVARVEAHSFDRLHALADELNGLLKQQGVALPKWELA